LAWIAETTRQRRKIMHQPSSINLMRGIERLGRPPRCRTIAQRPGRLYRAQNRYAEAEPLYKRDHAITEKALGPDHAISAPRSTT
jgi:hypothetical protein